MNEHERIGLIVRSIKDKPSPLRTPAEEYIAGCYSAPVAICVALGCLTLLSGMVFLVVSIVA